MVKMSGDLPRWRSRLKVNIHSFFILQPEIVRCAWSKLMSTFTIGNPRLLFSLFHYPLLQGTGLRREVHAYQELLPAIALEGTGISLLLDLR